MNIDTGQFRALTDELEALRELAHAEATATVAATAWESGYEEGRDALREELGIPVRRRPLSFGARAAGYRPAHARAAQRPGMRGFLRLVDGSAS